MRSLCQALTGLIAWEVAVNKINLVGRVNQQTNKHINGHCSVVNKNIKKIAE